VAETIEQKVRNYIAKNFIFEDSYPYSDDQSFLAKGIIDSTGVLELITFVQEEFGITVEDDELVPENLDSIQALGAFIRKKTPAEVSQAS
jgi:acyl carrier protein